jgi:hypothetical protein
MEKFIRHLGGGSMLPLVIGGCVADSGHQDVLYLELAHLRAVGTGRIRVF